MLRRGSRTAPSGSTGERADLGARLPAAVNVLKAALLAVAVCAAFGAVGWVVGGYQLLTVFVASAISLVASVYWYGDRIALGAVGARELMFAEAPALHSLVERLAMRAGIQKPRLQLIPDGHPRALATGRGPQSSTLALSRGLLGAAPPAELEGVVAHELAHVARYDVLPQTVAVAIAMPLIELSRIGGFLERALLFVLGPVASAFVHVLLSHKREFAADRAAAALCGSPHGLADALLRLEQASELVEFRASPATEPLYTINPFVEQGLAGLFATHPPVGDRVARLRALDPDWRDKLRAA